jgi:hypothetical protein
LFIQPSYNAQHLLLTPSRLSGEAFDVSTSSELQCLPDDYVDTMWKSANEFYFKSVASVQFMQRICLKPHGDITYDQVYLCGWSSNNFGQLMNQNLLYLVKCLQDVDAFHDVSHDFYFLIHAG